MPVDGYTPSVENIIYGSFVKMNKMRELTMQTFSNTSIASATELNVFIDLYSVLKSIFSEHYRTNIDDYTAITSGIINMCSHYRSFFRNLSVKTKFYLIFSFNTCDINRKFVAKYNEDFMRKSEIPVFNQLAKDNFELLDLLCPYLPDIFFVKSVRNYESSVIIAHIIEMLNDGKPNLIISKDIYPMQLTYLYPYTSFLFPKKFNGADDSIMLPINEKYNFRHEFWGLLYILRGYSSQIPIDISPVNFPLFCALNRFPERNILGAIANLTGAMNIIRKVVGSEDIPISSQQLYEDQEISSKIPVSKVEARMKVLDVKFMLPYYKADPESQVIQFQNLRDDAAINTINAQFFANNPLDLQKL